MDTQLILLFMEKYIWFQFYLFVTLILMFLYAVIFCGLLQGNHRI